MKLKAEIRTNKIDGHDEYYAYIRCFDGDGNEMPYGFFSMSDAEVGRHSLYRISTPWMDLEPFMLNAVPAVVLNDFAPEWRKTLEDIEGLRKDGKVVYGYFYDIQDMDRTKLSVGSATGTDNRGVVFKKNVVQVTTERTVEKKMPVTRNNEIKKYIVDVLLEDPYGDGYDYLQLRGRPFKLKLPKQHPPYDNVQSVKVNETTGEVIQAYSANLGQNSVKLLERPIGGVYAVKLKGDEKWKVEKHGDVFGNLCITLRGGYNKTFFEAVGNYGLRGCKIWISQAIPDDDERTAVRKTVKDKFKGNCYTNARDNAEGKRQITAYDNLTGFRWKVGKSGDWNTLICDNIIENVKKIYKDNAIATNNKGLNIELI